MIDLGISENEGGTFFASLSGCAPETAAIRCDERIRALQQRRLSIGQERDALPRNDRKRAGQLLEEIKRIEAESRRIRTVRGVYRQDADRKETNALWTEAVLQTAGADALTACRTWIKAERKRLAALRERC